MTVSKAYANNPWYVLESSHNTAVIQGSGSCDKPGISCCVPVRKLQFLTGCVNRWEQVSVVELVVQLFPTNKLQESLWDSLFSRLHEREFWKSGMKTWRESGLFLLSPSHRVSRRCVILPAWSSLVIHPEKTEATRGNRAAADVCKGNKVFDWQRI